MWYQEIWNFFVESQKYFFKENSKSLSNRLIRRIEDKNYFKSLLTKDSKRKPQWDNLNIRSRHSLLWMMIPRSIFLSESFFSSFDTMPRETLIFWNFSELGFPFMQYQISKIEFVESFKLKKKIVFWFRKLRKVWCGKFFDFLFKSNRSFFLLTFKDDVFVRNFTSLGIKRWNKLKKVSLNDKIAC